LVSAIDLTRRTGDRYCQFVAITAEFRKARGFGNLRNDGAKDWVTGRECDASFDLYFEDSRTSDRVVSVHYDIVERMALRRSLKFDTVNRCAGQATPFRTCQQRQQIMSSDLALEVAAGRSA
jgi:hypothetical protein